MILKSTNKILVPLTQDDLKLANKMAERRNLPKRQHNVVDRKIATRRSSLEIDVLGAKAEVAVAKWLGTHVQQHIPLYGDDGKDMMYRGLRVQVKATFNQELPLIFTKIESFNADVAILCTENKFGIIILGWTSRVQFKEKCKLKKLVKFAYCMDQQDLYNIHEFENYANGSGWFE